MKKCAECGKPLKVGEPAVLPLYCPSQAFHLDCLYHKLMKSNSVLQKRVGAVTPFENKYCGNCANEKVVTGPPCSVCSEDEPYGQWKPKLVTKQKGKKIVEIEIGKPGTYEVNIRTIKMVRVFQIKADKDGNVGLFV